MVRAAVVGLGWWGQHIVRRMRDSDALRITTAVESNPERAAFAAEHGLAFMGDLGEALADPAIDAIVLATPHALHTRQVAQVAGAGKHVFCEKPLALTRAEAEASVKACRRAGVVLGIGHERRYEPAIGALRDLVQAGTLGTIMHVEANFSHDKLAKVPEGDWRASPADAPAAGMTAMGVHLTDLCLDLVGPAAEVYAMTTSRVAYPKTGDVVTVMLRFASGATGTINAILVTPLYIALKVFGSEAWVEIVNATHPDTPGPTTMVVQHRDGRRDVSQFEWSDTVRTGLETFAHAIGGAPYPFSDAQRVGNVAILEAVCRSVATNAPVAVQPV